MTAIQSLGHAIDLLCKFSAQKASGNLDSSEHIYLGGAHGVRAYPQGEGSDELMSKDAESRGRLWFMAGKTF